MYYTIYHKQRIVKQSFSLGTIFKKEMLLNLYGKMIQVSQLRELPKNWVFRNRKLVEMEYSIRHKISGHPKNLRQVMEWDRKCIEKMEVTISLSKMH